jgi:hypothetical protein
MISEVATIFENDYIKTKASAFPMWFTKRRYLNQARRLSEIQT